MGSEMGKTSPQLPFWRQEYLNLETELQKCVTSGW